MPVNLTHREVRDLAKNLRDLTGRDIKHTEIIAAIAKAVGRPADSMMHELKNENASVNATPTRDEPINASHMMHRLGFSESPNGRRGRWIMRVLERRDPSPAALDIVIEPTADLRWLPSIVTTQEQWAVNVIHTSDIWNEKAERIAATSGGDVGLSLHSAVDVAFTFINKRHRLWENFDELQPEYELHELNPLAQKELDLRNRQDEGRKSAAIMASKEKALMGADPDSPIGRSRLLGFRYEPTSDGSSLLNHNTFLIMSSQGPSWRAQISADHPSGANSPTDAPVWKLHVLFEDPEGRMVAPIQNDLVSVNLDAALDRWEQLRADFNEIEAVWETARKQNPVMKGKTMTPQDSKRIATEAGFEIWDTGGGCNAFAKLLREVPTPGDDVASMDLMITIEGGCSIDASPDERVWGAGINYTDPRGGGSPRDTGSELYTLAEAITKAAEFEKEADLVWSENYDAAAIASHEGVEEDQPAP